MKAGKLTNEQLTDLVLKKLPPLSSDTLVGADIGADCAWINMGDRLMVTSSDPITAGGKQSGTLTVHVSCNDIAACGVKPSGLLIVIIAPVSATEDDISSIVEQASAEASKLGVDIVGGHTEVSDSVNTFVVNSTAFGIVTKDHPVPLGKVKPGDKLIMTKTCGIEGSFIAATQHRSRLEEAGVDPSYLTEASFYNELVSVVKEGAAAGMVPAADGSLNKMGFPNGAVSLMHDITEGGVFGAAYEMACYSGTGVLLDESKIPMTDATKAICEALKLDPFRLISSGSLMIAVAPDSLDAVLSALADAGVASSVIGEFTDPSLGYRRVDALTGSVAELEPPHADEVYKL
ncbi:MAG: AIR synthase family protein [Clostridiales bacterium]|nr:AIR synthase family protein [Clostridiales bacterium]